MQISIKRQHEDSNQKETMHINTKNAPKSAQQGMHSIPSNKIPGRKGYNVILDTERTLCKALNCVMDLAGTS